MFEFKDDISKYSVKELIELSHQLALAAPAVIPAKYANPSFNALVAFRIIADELTAKKKSSSMMISPNF